MTDYETADLAASYLSIGIACGGLYLTTVSAYLIVAYMVGERLKTFQVLVVSGLFLLFTLIGIWGGHGSMRWSALLVEKVPEVLPRTIPGEFRPYHGIVLLEIIGVLACLKFMWDIRHTKTD